MTFEPEFRPIEDQTELVIAEANQQIAYVLTEYLELYREVHQDQLDTPGYGFRD